MKNFLKPSWGKLMLTIVIFLVFVFLGASHVQICKFPPCDPIAIYSKVIIALTLWPFALAVFFPRFWNFLDVIIPIVFYILWAFYYYVIVCLWFYKKDTWKIKNYILIIIAALIILFSIFKIFNSGTAKFGPQLGGNVQLTACAGLDHDQCEAMSDCIPLMSEMIVHNADGMKEYELIFTQCNYLEEKYRNNNCEILFYNVQGSPEECSL